MAREDVITTTEALERLAAQYTLPDNASDRFRRLLELVAHEPAAITSIRDPREAVDVHIADSLVALSSVLVTGARRVADVGSGAGFPGLVLAVALPEAQVSLVEATARKARFLRHAVEELGVPNAHVVASRAEEWTDGLGRHDIVTARAVAALPVLLEYAAPLLAPAGVLVAWKGQRDHREEAESLVAAEALGMSLPVAHRVDPFPGALERRLYMSRKVRSTPNRFPRRPGMARKRPLGRAKGGESSSPANL